MDNEGFGVIVFSVLVLIFVSLTSFFTYKQGRKDERVALTMALIAQTKDTYYQGYEDAQKDCVNLK